MNTDGLNRALRYFVRQAQLYVLGILGGGIALIFYLWLIGGEGLSLQERILAIPEIIMFLAVFVVFICGMTGAQIYWSLPVSCNCRRQNVFIGNFVMNVLIVAESLMASSLAAVLLKRGDDCIPLTMYIAVFLAVEGVSQLGGTLMIKFGKIAYILMMVCIVLFSGIFGGIVGFMGVEGTVLPRFLYELTTPSWMLAVSAVLFIVTNTVSWRVFRKYEIKA